MKLHGGSRQVSVLGRCECIAKLPQCELHRFFLCDASGHIILSFFEVVKYFSCLWQGSSASLASLLGPDALDYCNQCSCLGASQ
ncbi:hypothetical protein D9M71_689280 [compost metagenome]